MRKANGQTQESNHQFLHRNFAVYEVEDNKAALPLTNAN